MFFFLITGTTLGLSSGLSPGPLFALVISETLNFGRKEGIKVAISPLITDIPIILLSYFVISSFADNNIIYGILSLAGGLFIGYFGYDLIRIKQFEVGASGKARSLQKGIIANLLNPSPYIFWIIVGIPTILKGLETSVAYALSFVIPFYICLIGSKITIALLVSKTGNINPKLMRYINIVLGIVLVLLAIKFIYDGVIYLHT
jgi:threonine/homoserine/homoserine lactone efflux protein